MIRVSRYLSAILHTDDAVEPLNIFTVIEPQNPIRVPKDPTWQKIPQKLGAEVTRNAQSDYKSFRPIRPEALKHST